MNYLVASIEDFHWFKFVNSLLKKCHTRYCYWLCRGCVTKCWSYSNAIPEQPLTPPPTCRWGWQSYMGTSFRCPHLQKSAVRPSYLSELAAFLLIIPHSCWCCLPEPPCKLFTAIHMWSDINCSLSDHLFPCLVHHWLHLWYLVRRYLWKYGPLQCEPYGRWLYLGH